MNIVNLPEPRGSWLCTVELWRAPGGSIVGRLVDMPPAVIETLPGEPADKLAAIPAWVSRGAVSLLRQARDIGLGAGR